MAELTGSEIIARCLQKEGITDLFYIMGGPMLLAEATCIKEGIRMIDVRHEQAAAFMCQAYTPVEAGAVGVHGGVRPGRHQPDHRHGQRAGGLLSGGGAGWVKPAVAVRPAGVPGDRPGRADARLLQIRRPADQPQAHPATDQFRPAEGDQSGKPGPVYLDCPGDMLYQKIDENLVDWSLCRPADAGQPADGRSRGRWMP